MTRTNTPFAWRENLLEQQKCERPGLEGRKDYEILEEALKAYLGLATLEKIWSRSDLGEERGLELAHGELREARRDRAGN